MEAHPIYTKVYCEECDETHEAYFVEDKGFLSWMESWQCEATAQEVGIPVDSLPENWEKEYIAEYGELYLDTNTRKWVRDSTYVLYPKNPPLMEFHRPIYYLENN